MCVSLVVLNYTNKLAKRKSFITFYHSPCLQMHMYVYIISLSLKVNTSSRPAAAVRVWFCLRNNITDNDRQRYMWNYNWRIRFGRFIGILYYCVNAKKFRLSSHTSKSNGPKHSSQKWSIAFNKCFTAPSKLCPSSGYVWNVNNFLLITIIFPKIIIKPMTNDYNIEEFKIIK